MGNSYNRKNPMQTKTRLWLCWVLATGTGGGIIAFFAAPTDFFWELLMSGFVTGFAQWLVLRRYIQPVFWWFPLSGIGWILGIYLRIFTDSLLDSVVRLLSSVGGLWEVFWLNVVNEPITFTLLGVAQWLVLQRYVKYSWLWILACSLGGITRGAIGSIACNFVCQLGFGVISNGAGWAASAAITGTMLSWLLIKHPKTHPNS